MVEAFFVDGVNENSAIEIDRNLRTIATRRAGLDAELGRWLRRADQQRIWNELGYVHALEYLEDVFGFSPRSGRERLRVANELAGLPALERELERGSLSYGVVRELTRVATPETESRWLAAARGKNLRQVERLVAGHEKGDAPDDDVNPDMFESVFQWKLPAPVASLLRETRKHLNDEVGENLEDVEFVEMLCRRALEPACEVARELGAGTKSAREDATTASSPASGPARMIHISTCRSCKTTTQVGGGRCIPITVEELELASCDAVVVDDENGKRPTQSIPAAVRRQVMERDEHRCRVPGCRSTRNLDVHHLIPQCLGGGHELWNLIVLCSGHHRLHHKGALTISGRADGELTFMRRGRALADDKNTHMLARHGVRTPPDAARSPKLKPALQAERKTMATAASLQEAERNAMATDALRQSGFKQAIAAEAVRRAASQLAVDADLPTLLREALRYCR